MKLSLCLEMLFVDRPFLERMEAAHQLGYEAIEFWDWRDKDIPATAALARRLGLTIAAMSGNRNHTLINPDDRAGLVEEMEEVLAVAQQVGCSRVMMLSDVLRSDGSAKPAPPLTWTDKFDSLIEGLHVLAGRAESAGITLLIEPLNTRVDHRGCFLERSEIGVEAVRRVASPRVKLLYDIYHMAMMGEDGLAEIERHSAWIGHIHVADMPGRHQPGTGTIDYRGIHSLLQRIGYQEFVGMEFSALGPDVEAAQVPLEIFS